MKTMTSRDFNQDVGRAKRMAREEPVIITDRGRPSHVLMSHESFETMRSAVPAAEPDKPMTLFDIFADPSPEADFDFEVPRWGVEQHTVEFD